MNTLNTSPTMWRELGKQDEKHYIETDTRINECYKYTS